MESAIHRIARKLCLAKPLMFATIGLAGGLGPAGFGLIMTGSGVRAQGRSESGQAEPVPRGLSYDSSALLDRARRKIASTTRRLLKCTCLETIERSYYTPSEKINAKVMTEAPANSCDAKEFGGNGPLALDLKDRLRLGVTVLGDQEINSWAAASRFDSRPVFQIVSSGPIHMGSFGTYLPDVFENPGTKITFTGKKNEGSGEVFEYTFEVPAKASHYSVGTEKTWRITGYRGSFQIYSATAELARLIDETEQLPPETGMCRARSRFDYHYMLIGGDEFLLPRESRVETLSVNANETSSIITFSGCREYSAESSLRFDAEEARTTVKPGSQVPARLPPGLSLTLALLGYIDPVTAAAGDAVSAKVSAAVRAPHSNQILVPAGAIAHGRILLMQHQYSSSRFLISIRFDTLEANGVVTPLSLQWDRELKAEKTRTQNGFRDRATEFSLPPSPTGESGGVFSLSAARAGYVLPRGLKSKWITVNP